MAPISVISTDVVDAVREAKASLAKALQDAGASRVAIWGCSDTGEVIAHLLASSGIALGAVYDSVRRGAFCGQEIRNPQVDLDPSLPVIIASARGPEQLTEVTGHLARHGVPHFFANGGSRKDPTLAMEERCAIRPDSEKLRTFKNRHKGKRCFIIGNGPSLNQIELSRLAGEPTFAVNGIFYKTRETGFTPTYYVVEDKHVMRENRDEINAIPVTGQKFFPTDYKEHITDPRSTFFRMNWGYYNSCSPNFCVPRFSTDAAERVYAGQSVTIANLQLAYYMGFSQVYLVGMDFSYVVPKTARIDGPNITSTEDDPNHFHPDYFGKGRTWHDPKLDRVLTSYRMAKLVYEATGRTIFNATVGGQLEEFPRVPFDSLF